MRFKARTLRAALSALLVCLACTGNAYATLVFVDGSTFGANYDLQYDDTQLGLYGTPTISGSGNVEFTPPDFSAKSAFGFADPFTGSPVATTQSDLVITLIAHTGFEFDGITLTEGGSYRLNGATSSVSAGGGMDVYEGGTISGAHEQDGIVSGTTFVKDNVFHSWAASASVDLTGAVWDGLDTIDIVVDNTLIAFTAPGSFDSAEIQKETTATGVSLGVNMNGGAGGEVPIPAAVWLFASGLLGLVGVARRRKITA